MVIAMLYKFAAKIVINIFPANNLRPKIMLKTANARFPVSRQMQKKSKTKRKENENKP